LVTEFKEQQVRELHDRFSRAKAAILADYKGLNVQKVNELRKMLRGAEVELKVIKNTLAIIASKGTPFEAASRYFTGPTSLALSYKDPIAPAKIMVSYAKKNDKLNIKAGILEGKLIEADGIRRLSELPPKEVLIAKTLFCMKMPATNLVSVLQGIMKKFIYTLKAIEEAKNLKGGK
jgi:large subunit ribosomal protein L10